MSVVAMYHDAKKGKVYAASDGITLSGHRLTSTDSIKLHRGRNSIVGACGSTFMGQVWPKKIAALSDAVIKKTSNREDFYNELANQFAFDPNLQASSAAQQKIYGQDLYIQFLLGCKYGLFVGTAPAMTIARVSKPFHAIGAGGTLSEGSLDRWFSSNNNGDGEEAVRGAVKAACNSSAYVTGKIRSEILEV